MPLRLWIGPAGSGKTARCLAALREEERAGRRATLLVPEQFTYAADRLLLDDPDLPGTRFVRVMSFRRLAHLAAARGEPKPTLTEEGRRLLLRRIVHETALDSLGPLASVRNTPGFVTALAHAIREAKGIAGSTAAARLAAAAQENAKAAAVARLLAAYDAALALAGLADPSEAAHATAEALARDPGPWGGQCVLVDGFMSFTPEEQAFLESLARIASELTVTVCADPADAATALAHATEMAARGVSPFSAEFYADLRPRLRRPAFLPTLRTLVKLDALVPGPRRVENLGAEGTPARFAGAPELARLESRLFVAEPGGGSAAAPAVSLTRFATPYHEVVGWARWIDRRARLGIEPCRYRDIAILVRDLEAYRPLVPEVFARYGIPVFIDQRRDATAHPLLRLVLVALRAAQGWTREVVIALLRNPLLGLDPDEIDRIENLSLEYGIEYERWHGTDWGLPPLPPRESDEPVVEEEEEEENGAADRISRRQIRTLGRRRAAGAGRAIAQRFFPALRDFTDLWRAGEPEFATAADALERLLADFARASGQAEGDDPVAAWAAAPGDPARGGWPAEESAQVVVLLRETLAAGRAFMPRVPVGAGLFTRLLKDSLCQASIGSTPQSLDAVIVAEPRRSRVNETRCVILGGLVAGAFPPVHAQDPLFSDAERDALARAGFPIAAGTDALAEEEPYLFYVAATRASRELRLTAPALAERGKSTEPSSHLAEVARALGREPTEPVEPEAGSGLDACQHEWELGAAAARQLRAAETDSGGDLLAGARREAPSLVPAIDRAARLAARLRSPAVAPLPAEVVDALHPGSVLLTSASGLESFARCPFQYFAHHVLRLEPRPEAVLTPLSTGGAVHAALERFFAERGEDEPDDAAAERMRAIFRELADREEFRAFQLDPPSAYRWELTGRHLAGFLASELRRLRGSPFLPVAVELSFGYGTPEHVAALNAALRRGRPVPPAIVPPLELPVAGWRVRLRGRIDRLDVRAGGDGPLRGLVVDYKSRPRTRSPRSELARGTDLQVAAYVLVVADVLGLEPAGGVYYAVSPQPHGPDEEVHAANRLRFGMQGFLAPGARAELDPEDAFHLKESDEADLDETLDTARAAITGLAARIVSGRIAPEPQVSGGRSPCLFCDYRSLCRRDPTVEPEGGA
jgi:ATP-dependent helicase/nuclease subunit B